MLHQYQDTRKDSWDMPERILFAMGRDMFAAGRSLEECATVPERRGFLSALYAAADADTSAYLVAHPYRGDGKLSC